MMKILAIIGAVFLVWLLLRGAAKFARTVKAEIESKDEEARVMEDMRRMQQGIAPVHHSAAWYQRRIEGRQ